jgi:hypothetical protein
VSTPQPSRAREIVRGVDVEKQELRVAEAPDLGQREDTERDAWVEADGAKVSRVEGGGDGVPAAGTVGGAERLDPAMSVALGQQRVVIPESLGERPDQRR